MLSAASNSSDYFIRNPLFPKFNRHTGALLSTSFLSPPRKSFLNA